MKMSNTQSLHLKVNHKPHLDWLIVLKSKINFTKVSPRKKIHKKNYERQFRTYRHFISTLLR